MRLALPAAVRPLPLHRPAAAVQAYAGILAELRDGAAGDLEAIATEAVETALREHAVLLAVVTPPGTAPALLTGTVLAVPTTWGTDSAEALRDALEDRGARQTALLAVTPGPAVLAQRDLRLQAFLPRPASGRLLLLTLVGSAARGWRTHQSLLTTLVTTADGLVEDSFADVSYRL